MIVLEVFSTSNFMIVLEVFLVYLIEKQGFQIYLNIYIAVDHLYYSLSFNTLENCVNLPF